MYFTSYAYNHVSVIFSIRFGGYYVEGAAAYDDHVEISRHGRLDTGRGPVHETRPALFSRNTIIIVLIASRIRFAAANDPRGGPYGKHVFLVSDVCTANCCVGRQVPVVRVPP